MCDRCDSNAQPTHWKWVALNQLGATIAYWISVFNTRPEILTNYLYSLSDSNGWPFGCKPNALRNWAKGVWRCLSISHSRYCTVAPVLTRTINPTIAHFSVVGITRIELVHRLSPVSWIFSPSLYLLSYIPIARTFIYPSYRYSALITERHSSFRQPALATLYSINRIFSPLYSHSPFLILFINDMGCPYNLFIKKIPNLSSSSLHHSAICCLVVL